MGFLLSRLQGCGNVCKPYLDPAAEVGADSETDGCGHGDGQSFGGVFCAGASNDVGLILKGFYLLSLVTS